MIEAMIDLETWGVRTTSVVRSVGVVLFEGRAVLEKHYFRIDEDLQAELGRTKDMSTVFWWRKPENVVAQERIAQAPLLNFDDAGRLMQSIGERANAIWAKPGMFDLPMLRDLFGQQIWPYWKERDMSTLLAEFDPERKTRPDFAGTPHVALDDAVWTHEWLCDLRAAIPLMVKRGQKTAGGHIWTCKIGEHSGESPSPHLNAADVPMRQAVEQAYRLVTGHEPKFTFSGWGGSLDTIERSVVDGK